MIAPGRIGAVLLAAGQSRRFGGDDKLLAPLAGQPLVLHAARALVALAPARLIAVCGADRDGAVGALLAPLGFEVVANRKPEQGLSRSLALGIGALDVEEAALVCLGDMPGVSVAHLRALLAGFDPVAAPVVASARAGRAMVPALFARDRFAALQALQGDAGARALLAGAELVEAGDAILADIDTPADLAAR